MRSLRSDPYLWVHLAGVAAAPIFLELCLLGLGMGRSLMPIWFELLFVGGLGIAPILWMQWQKPFCIFSLLVLALRPDQLSEEQRKLLGLFKSPVNQFLSVGVAVLMAGVLWWLYGAAPIANGLIFPSATRGTGLLMAAIAFFFANLFLQVPASVLRVLLVNEGIFAATDPYPVEQIPIAFTLVGLKVKKILPPLIPKPSKPVVIRPVEVSAPKAAQKIEEAIQPDLKDAVAEVAEVGEAIETVFEEPETLLNVEVFEEATFEEEPDAAEAIAAETDTVLEEIEEAIAQQESEAVMESEIIELEIIELEAVTLSDENVLDADEIIEVVEIESVTIQSVEIEVVETGSEEERAIAPEPTEEDWGDDDDLDDM
jgi:hypothetical protein